MAHGAPHKQHVQLSMAAFLSPPKKREVIDLLSDDDDRAGPGGQARAHGRPNNASSHTSDRSATNGVSNAVGSLASASKNVDVLQQPLQPLESLQSSQETCDLEAWDGKGNANGGARTGTNGRGFNSDAVARTIEGTELDKYDDGPSNNGRGYIDLMQSNQRAVAMQDMVNAKNVEPLQSLPTKPDQTRSNSILNREHDSSDDEISSGKLGATKRAQSPESPIISNGDADISDVEHEDDEEDELLEEIIHQILEEIDSDGDEEDLSEEGRALIRSLRRDGIHEFVHDNLESNLYSADQMCALLGCPLPDILREMDNFDDLAFNILGKILMKETSRRRKLPQYNTIDDAANLLRNARRILVLTGAGISTSLGIPDFRSSNGLYAQLAKSGLADRVDDPQDVFSLRVFREDPAIFYAVARSILSSDRRFSPTHQFIRLIQDKGKLQTNFTQNIDNLEAAAGIATSKLIHCHGSFASATCQECGYNVPGDQIHDEIRAGAVPRCRVCIARLQKLRISNSSGMKRKRSGNGSKARKNKAALNAWDEDDTDDDIVDTSDEAAGVMKPDIIFFGEDLSDAFHSRAIADKMLVDLVVVIGTSLKVAPVSEVPNFIPSEVPQIYISRDPCRHITFDIQLLGECDVVVAELCKRAGWDLQHEMVPKGGYKVEVTEMGDHPGRNIVKRLDAVSAS